MEAVLHVNSGWKFGGTTIFEKIYNFSGGPATAGATACSLTEMISISKCVDGTGEKNPILDIVLFGTGSLKTFLIKGLNIVSNARFVEIYIKCPGAEFNYIETVRGGLVSLPDGYQDLQMFGCDSEKILECSHLRLKFVSLKVDPNTVTLLNISFVSTEKKVPSDDSLDDTSAVSKPDRTPTAESGFSLPGAGATGHFGVAVEAIKTSLLRDISLMMDSKLSPIVYKMNVMDAKLEALGQHILKISSGAHDSSSTSVAGVVDNLKPPPPTTSGSTSATSMFNADELSGADEADVAQRK